MRGFTVAALLLGCAVLALSCGAGVADAQTCTNYKNCTTCTKLLNCGWCSATASCLPGNAQKPTDSQCLGKAWHHGVNNCTDCAKVKNCRECVDWAADCYWCGADSQQPPYGHCRDLGLPAFGCSATTECDCSHYSECGGCLEDGNCKWCTATESCQKPSETCTSPAVHTCPCSQYRECGACAADDNCNWCTDPAAAAKGVCEQAGQCGLKLIPTSCNAFCGSQGGNCDACNSIPGCNWCSKGQCKDSNFRAGEDCGMFVHTCPINCGSATECEACHTMGGGCQWCGDSDSCIDSGKSSCDDWVSECSSGGENQQCENEFNGGSFVGGMFTVIGVLVLGAAGYFFYRWKMGQRVKYTELGE